MATFTAAPTAGRFNVWIPPAHLGNIARRTPGQTFPQGAYVAWNTLAEAVQDVTSKSMGVILDPSGAFASQQAWAGASAFTAAGTSPAPVTLTPATPGQPPPASPTGSPITTSVPGLPPLTDLTSSIRGDIEALVATKTPTGMRVALRFRSMKAGEYPSDLHLKLTQSALGVVVLQKLSEVVKPVAPNSTVSEGEFTIDYSTLAAQGLQTGAALGLYAKWSKFGSHDRDYGENPLYQFKAP